TARDSKRLRATRNIARPDSLHPNRNGESADRLRCAPPPPPADFVDPSASANRAARLEAAPSSPAIPDDRPRTFRSHAEVRATHTQEFPADGTLRSVAANTRRFVRPARSNASPRHAVPRFRPCASAPQSSRDPRGCDTRNRKRPTGVASESPGARPDRTALAANTESARSPAHPAKRRPTEPRLRRDGNRPSAARAPTAPTRRPARLLAR